MTILSQFLTHPPLPAPATTTGIYFLIVRYSNFQCIFSFTDSSSCDLLRNIFQIYSDFFFFKYHCVSQGRHTYGDGDSQGMTHMVTVPPRAGTCMVTVTPRTGTR